MSRSIGGNLLIQAFYTNQAVIEGRLSGIEASGIEKSYASSFYDLYRPFIEDALNDPGSTTRVVTQQHIDDAYFMLYGIEAYLTIEEIDAFYTLFFEVVDPTLGMDFNHLISHMNDPTVFARVTEVLAAVPTIEVPGPIYPLGGTPS